MVRVALFDASNQAGLRRWHTAALTVSTPCHSELSERHAPDPVQHDAGKDDELKYEKGEADRQQDDITGPTRETPGSASRDRIRVPSP